MPQRKRAARKASTRTRSKAPRRPARKSAAASAELPGRLRDFSKELRSQLLRVERELVSAQASYRRRAARLLREGSVELGRLEAKGEREWQRLSERARRDVLSILRRIEKLVGPVGGQKRSVGATQVARKATRHAQRALREVASKVAPGRR